MTRLPFETRIRFAKIGSAELKANSALPLGSDESALSIEVGDSTPATNSLDPNVLHARNVRSQIGL